MSNNCSGKCAYAAWSLDDELKKTSSSGGIAPILYKQILKEGGIIVGVKFDENLSPVYYATTNEKDIELFKGSKYIKASLCNIYQKIEEFLNDNKKVIFIGTPCHVEGLNNCIKKLSDDKKSNLVTVDLICYGVPSQKLFKEHIECLEKKLKCKIKNASFRGKGGNHLILYDEDENIVYKKEEYEDLYYRGYIKGVFLNESCYNCKFKNIDRVADITIGDFGGLEEKDYNHSTKNGVSLIIINTKKGKILLEKCKDKLFLEEKELEIAIAGNVPLRRNTIKTEEHDRFIKLYKKNGFEIAATNCIKEKLYTKIIKNIRENKRYKILRRILSKAHTVIYNAKIELKYFMITNTYKFPHVKTEFETAEELINSNKSLARLGDAEMRLLKGYNIRYQEPSELLSKRLTEVLNSTEENVLVGFNNVFSYKSLFGCKKNIKKFWKEEIVNNKDIYLNLDENRTYENACVTRVYMRYKNKTKKVVLFGMLKKIWQDKDIIFVEGNNTKLGIGNDLFENAKSIQRIIAPNSQAFKVYDNILKETMKQDKSKVILIALGPTATVLAYDLGKLGYRAIDIGHLDIEYEWYLKQAESKIAVQGKFVNETKEEQDLMAYEKNKEYNSQIVAKIRTRLVFLI